MKRLLIAAAVLWVSSFPPPAESRNIKNAVLLNNVSTTIASSTVDSDVGVKTIQFLISGTATVEMQCSVHDAAPLVVIDEIDQTEVDASGNAMKEFSTTCNRFRVEVTACTACSVSVWLTYGRF